MVLDERLKDDAYMLAVALSVGSRVGNPATTYQVVIGGLVMQNTQSEPRDVFLFPNGNIAVTDQHGGQMVELQELYVLMIAQRLEQAGYDPSKIIYHLPAGDAKLFRVDGGYNWTFTTREMGDNG